MYKKILLRVDLLGGTNYLDKLYRRLRVKVGGAYTRGSGGVGAVGLVVVEDLLPFRQPLSCSLNWEAGRTSARPPALPLGPEAHCGAPWPLCCAPSGPSLWPPCGPAGPSPPGQPGLATPVPLYPCDNGTGGPARAQHQILTANFKHQLIRDCKDPYSP